MFYSAGMVKTLTKVGNSYALIFDATLRELSGLKPGDSVNVTVHDGGAIVLTPMNPVIEASEAQARAEKLIRENSELFRRLA
jgi:antitoxin component of MazEF toxin-antitoxin module